MTATPFLKKLRSNNYRLLGLVGQGQFGQVYCAIHRKTGRLVALKNLNRDRFPTHRFLRELRFLLSLDHPHIANCLALEQSAYGRQLVLDYCEGGTLRDLLEQETPLTLAEILTLVTEVLEALEHAQHKSIVHCDIKPENILLTLTPEGWRAKVSDFGIARLSQELSHDQTGATGSPAYMAPERFYHQNSASSDLYAMGVVLYEMLLGDRPFSGNYQQLMVAHLNQALKLPDTVPAGIRPILARSLAKLMGQRFRSAAEMKAAIVAARKTLTASELRDRFPQPLAAIPTCTFAPTATLPLDGPCTALGLLAAEEPPLLVAAADTYLARWALPPTIPLGAPPTWRWPLATPVQQIVNTAQGAIAVGERHLYHLTATQPPQAISTFDVPIRLVPGGQRWLMVQSQTQPHQFWLMDTLKAVPPSPRSLPPLPVEGHCLSHLLGDHFLLLAAVRESVTHLHILTRWGKRCGQLTLQTPLHQLFPSAQKPYSFLAQAGTHQQDLLVVQLKPYRVMRCRLDITVDWVGELALGFVVVSAKGQMRLINFYGQMIGKVEGLPPPSAIAFQPPYQVWLATPGNGQAQIYPIDIRNLDLDIVF